MSSKILGAAYQDIVKIFFPLNAGHKSLELLAITHWHDKCVTRTFDSASKACSIIDDIFPLKGYV